MDLLKDLREKPKETIETSFIYLENTLKKDVKEKRIKIEEDATKTTIKQATVLSITSSNDPNDYDGYFFPYIQNDVGYVDVQFPKDGTIVLTPPMNGCALEVRFFHGYTFYHDANGRNMNKVQQLKGSLLCRIEAEAYWDDEKYGVCAPKALPAVQFVCVYLKQMWYVGAFGLQLKPKGLNQNELCGVFEPIGGRFRGCFNSIQYLTK